MKKNILKNNGVQSLLASLLCIVLGLLIVIGGVLLALGQMVQGKRKEAADRQGFDTLAPEVVNSVFENADLSPAEHTLHVEDSHIPLPAHSCHTGSGYIRGLYEGLPTEMCTVVLTDVDEVQRPRLKERGAYRPICRPCFCADPAPAVRLSYSFY